MNKLRNIEEFVATLAVSDKKKNLLIRKFVISLSINESWF